MDMMALVVLNIASESCPAFINDQAAQANVVFSVAVNVDLAAIRDLTPIIITEL
jgi:hypothetical protein